MHTRFLRWLGWTSAAALAGGVALSWAGSWARHDSNLQVKIDTHRVGEPIDDEVLLRTLVHAEGLLNIGAGTQAAQAVAGLSLENPYAPAILRTRAWGLWLAKDFQQLNELLQSEAPRGELGLLQGAAQQYTGNLDAATRTLRQVWWHEPASPWGLAALWTMAQRSDKGAAYTPAERKLIQRLVPAPSPQPPYNAVETILTKLLKQAPRRSLLAAEVAHALGVMHLHHERFSEAVTYFRRSLKGNADAEFARPARLRLGEALRRRGSYRAALAQLDAVAAEKNDVWANMANAIAGQMAVEFRRYPEAKRRFEALLLSNPLGPKRSEALWGLGWVAFRTGDFGTARQFFLTLVHEAPFGPLAPSGLYWAARSLQELGQQTVATAELISLVRRFPLDYYAYRASYWVEEDVQAAIPATEHSRPEVQQVIGYMAADMRDRARNSLEQAMNAADEVGPADLDQLIALAEKLIIPRAEKRLVYLRERRFPSGGRALTALAPLFPARYVRFIEREAKKQRLDPAIVVGLVRQESAFNPRATSSAGALGLMQLMPTTASQLMDERKMGRFTPEKLYDAKLNAQLGCSYFGRMLRAFGGHLEYALAAYNAGPGAVTRWRQLQGELPLDIFAEEIPYSETRQYVRKVLSWSRAYNYLRQQQHELALR